MLEFYEGNPKPLPILDVHVPAREWFTDLHEVHYSQLMFEPQPSIIVSYSAIYVVCIKSSILPNREASIL